MVWILLSLLDWEEWVVSVKGKDESGRECQSEILKNTGFFLIFRLGESLVVRFSSRSAGPAGGEKCVPAKKKNLTIFPEL